MASGHSYNRHGWEPCCVSLHAGQKSGGEPPGVGTPPSVEYSGKTRKSPRPRSLPPCCNNAEPRSAVSATCDDGGIWGGGGFFCENVDGAVDCIGSPNAAAGSTEHFNARNLFEGNVENFVKDAAEGRHEHRSAVDHHQHFVAEATVEPPDTDGPTAGINLCDLHTRDRSGMLVAPERRISSSVMTKMAAAVLQRDCSWPETEVTSTFISSSIFICVRWSDGVCG
jgi:hypothetical protein